MLKKNKQVVIAILVVLVAIFWFLQNSRQQEITELDSEHQTVEQKLKTQNTANKKTQPKSTTSQKQNRQKNLSLKEEFLNSNYFSEDPLINSQIILTKYYTCFDFFKTADNSYVERLTRKMSGVRKETLDAYLEYCESAAADHPEFLLNNEKLFHKFKKELLLKSNSLISQASLNQLNFRGKINLARQYLKELKQEPTLLMYFSHISHLSDFHREFSTINLSQLLNTQDLDYISFIIEQAQTLSSCEHSQECGAFSSKMIELCMFNEQACGLTDYSEYIEINFTQGVQADIKIAYDYIETLFDSL